MIHVIIIAHASINPNDKKIQAPGVCFHGLANCQWQFSVLTHGPASSIVQYLA